MKKGVIFVIIFLIPFIFAGLPSQKKVKEISRAIWEGKIDVGTEYDMEPGQRWHNIHSEVLKIDCSDCHIEKYDNDYLYQRRYKVPVRDAPGVVKREVCLKCHREGGPTGMELYGKSK